MDHQFRQSRRTRRKGNRAPPNLAQSDLVSYMLATTLHVRLTTWTAEIGHPAVIPCTIMRGLRMKAAHPMEQVKLSGIRGIIVRGDEVDEAKRGCHGS